MGADTAAQTHKFNQLTSTDVARYLADRPLPTLPRNTWVAKPGNNPISFPPATPSSARVNQPWFTDAPYFPVERGVFKSPAKKRKQQAAWKRIRTQRRNEYKSRNMVAVDNETC